MLPTIFYVLLALVGLCVGSFCNVLILRLPRGEEFVKTPSHCMTCGHRLRWYELVPLVSWLVQGGKCRACGAPISRQYPIVEAANACAWLLAAAVWGGDGLRLGLYCALSSLLLVAAVIDERTFEIPDGLNLAIGVLGAVQVIADREHWLTYLLGGLCAGGFFFLLTFLLGGAAMGMGDAKLMAAAGLLLGGPRVFLAVLVGSVTGSVVHLVRMRFGAGRTLAFGPYLAFGIWVAALFGDGLIQWYLGLFGL